MTQSLANPKNDMYQSPLIARYASKEMSHLFSAQFKHSTWRKLWIALAEAEKELGLAITQEQIDELKAHVDDIDFDIVDKYESELHHDVMAHIHAYGDLCPNAKPIIHLGATSCYVTDNTEMIQIVEGLKLLSKKLDTVIESLTEFARKYAHTACLSYTHFQPAQLTTVGKRACLWLQDFLIDKQELNYRLGTLKFLGVKGTTGTQASFLSLFSGDHEKVKKLDKNVAEKMGFQNLLAISGQTYSRKQDYQVLSTLSGIAQSAHKSSTDIRLLASHREIEEGFGKKQVGSSAMPYKRNPILSERVCALARFLISLSENPAYTAAIQWLERSLDDSANRRLCIPEAFLTCDAILSLIQKVFSELVVNEHIIAKRVSDELPFMATENILMACVSKGGDRQRMHEKIRQHSIEAAKNIKAGKKNDLIDRITQDPEFSFSKDEITQLLNVKAFIGRAPQQVEELVHSIVHQK